MFLTWVIFDFLCFPGSTHSRPVLKITMMQILGHCASAAMTLMVYVGFRLCRSARDQLEMLSYHVADIRVACIPRECVYIALDVIGMLYDWANQMTFITFQILVHHNPYTSLLVWMPHIIFYYDELGFAISILEAFGLESEF